MGGYRKGAAVTHQRWIAARLTPLWHLVRVLQQPREDGWTIKGLLAETGWHNYQNVAHYLNIAIACGLPIRVERKWSRRGAKNISGWVSNRYFWDPTAPCPLCLRVQETAPPVSKYRVGPTAPPTLKR